MALSNTTLTKWLTSPLPPPPNADERATTDLPSFILGEALARHNQGDPQRLNEKPALIDGLTGKTLTYHRLISEVVTASHRIVNDAVFQPNDVVAIYSTNQVDYPVVFFSFLAAGIVLTTLSPMSTSHDLEYHLKGTNAKGIVTIPAFLDNVLTTCSKSGIHLKRIYVLVDSEEDRNTVVSKGAIPFSVLSSNGSGTKSKLVLPKRPENFNSKSQIAVLPHSSGTTGPPKSVKLSHYSLIINLLQIHSVESQSISSNDVFLGILPFFHMYGLTVILNLTVWLQATAVLMQVFDFEPMLQLIQKYKVSVAHLVPPIILLLAKSPVTDKYDLSSIKTIMSGAAPLSSSTEDQLKVRLPGITVRQAYGMTELSPASHLIHPNHIRKGSVGLLLPLQEARFMDPETGELFVTPNRIGEICIKGPNVMLGYLNNESATTAMIDTDGFLHTGDLGYVDSDGYYYIVDRIKELIKYKGFQVAPAELEALLLTHPDIADAAVIPVPDEEAGEFPKAYVVLKLGKKVTEKEIQAFIDQQVAPYKKLRGGVEFIEVIPKSPSGKILRRVLRDQAKLQAKL